MSITIVRDKSKVISLASRLMELLEETNRQKKELYTPHNNKNNITRWCNVDNPVNPDRITNFEGLQEIADLLQVDVDYLLCKQVEKRKSDNRANFAKFNEKFDTQAISESVALMEFGDSFKHTLQNIGYSFEYVPTSWHEDETEYQTIERLDESHFYLLTLRDTFTTQDEYEVEILKKGKRIAVLSADDFQFFLESAKAHILCELGMIERKQNKS